MAKAKVNSRSNTTRKESKLVRKRGERISTSAQKKNGKTTNASTKTTGRTLKKRRGKAISKEIKHIQKTTDNLIPRASFQRVVRTEMMMQLPREAYRFTKEALEVLQIAAEDYIVSLNSTANRLAAHAGRVTIKPADLKMAQDLSQPQ